MVTPERILVVDDDPTIRNILVQVLRHQGYEVESDCNGAEAYGRLQHDPRPFDALITDLMMPVMTGRELIEKARELQPGIRVMCLSAAYDDVWLDLQVLFVPKPFSLRGILALVRSALEGPGRRETETG